MDLEGLLETDVLFLQRSFFTEQSTPLFKHHAEIASQKCLLSLPSTYIHHIWKNRYYQGQENSEASPSFG